MTPDEQNKVDISEPRKWALRHLQHEWHHLKGAPLAFLIILMAGFGLGSAFVSQIVVPSKNASIETLKFSGDGKQERLINLEKEKESLVRQNADLKSANAERLSGGSLPGSCA